LAGAGITLLLFPFVRFFARRYVEKHKDQVVEAANELAEHTLQLVREAKKRKQEHDGGEKPIDLIEIEIRDEETTRPGSLKNNLRT
jgi:hypothetical protein